MQLCKNRCERFRRHIFQTDQVSQSLSLRLLHRDPGEDGRGRRAAKMAIANRHTNANEQVSELNRYTSDLHRYVKDMHRYTDATLTERSESPYERSASLCEGHAQIYRRNAYRAI